MVHPYLMILIGQCTAHAPSTIPFLLFIKKIRSFINNLITTESIIYINNFFNNLMNKFH